MTSSLKSGTLLGRIVRFLSTSDEEKYEDRSASCSSNARHCVLVIDVSPSMEETDWKPSRLAASQEAAKTFIRRLQREDPSAKVGVVSYGGSAKIVCPFIEASLYNIIEKRIDDIKIVSSTNITAGLMVAHGLLYMFDSDCHIILLTDGDHNSGPKPYEVADMIKQYAVIECVGIGGNPTDVNEEMLRAIASEHPDSTKRYRWIGDKERLVQHFHTLAGRITKS